VAPRLRSRPGDDPLVGPARRLEALEQGTTAIVDHHESPQAIEGSLDVIAAAGAEVGIRVVCAYGVTDRHGREGARRGLEENRRFLQAGAGAWSGCTRPSPATTRPWRRRPAGCRPGSGVHIHVAEGPGDIAAADRLAGLSRDDWLMAHCVHLPDDHRLRGTIAHNPAPT